MKKILAFLLIFAVLSTFAGVIAVAADDAQPAASDVEVQEPAAEEESETVDNNVYPRTKFQLYVAIVMRLIDKLIQLITGNTSFSLPSLGLA